MDASKAVTQSGQIVADLVSGLTPDHRDLRTPCDKWNVHELVEHICQGGYMIAGALQDQTPDTPDDVLADGPVAGWSAASAALAAAATPEALAATHQLSFGDLAGETVLSIIAADHLTHAWDLAKATDQAVEISDELAEWALATFSVVVPAEGRTGDGFAPVVPVPDTASPVDRLIAYTGRQP